MLEREELGGKCKRKTAQAFASSIHQVHITSIWSVRGDCYSSSAYAIPASSTVETDPQIITSTLGDIDQVRVAASPIASSVERHVGSVIREGQSWAMLGPSGPSWEALRGLPKPSGGVLGPSGAVWGPPGALRTQPPRRAPDPAKSVFYVCVYIYIYMHV